MVDAHSPEPLVDLDRPAPVRPAAEPGVRLRSGLRRLRAARVQVSAVALATVVGGVAGGVGVHRFETRQALAAEQSTVQVGAQLLEPPNMGGSSDGVNASMVTNLTLVNLGPLPIEVLDLSAARDGVEFRNASQEAVIRPGFRTMAVWVTFACTRGTISTTEPLPLHLRVRTADGQTRQVDTTVEIGVGANWPRLLESLCRDTSR
ncbi:hypothetical protein [Asanoa iriomotensis]|uniref:DUF4232 domain-containing protein n=1 Tax=Asanoa iriomotensis TaxID=234613 RepID=A0ABQ4CAR4_9ACTN|nr:hypothetical protein [Asanoa iriomotensis]GIF59844.1 hypothetical protein Air01nite_59390 [Asanoa iriomotensis]